MKRKIKKPIRIIPVLDIKNGVLIKGINLEGLRVLGIPRNFANYYYTGGADEIVYIDEELPAELILKNKALEIYNYGTEKYTELKYFCGEFIKNNKFIKDGSFLNKSSYLIYFYTFSIVFFLGISSSLIRTNF